MFKLQPTSITFEARDVADPKRDTSEDADCCKKDTEEETGAKRYVEATVEAIDAWFEEDEGENV